MKYSLKQQNYSLTKIILLACIFFINTIYTSFGKEPHKMIMFQGQEKYLMHLIIASHFDHKHPFSTTQIIRKEQNNFYHHGDILNLNEQDFNNIHHINYVYLENHTQGQTRFSNEKIVPVNLLILGTNDKESCLQLNFKQNNNQQKSIVTAYNFIIINSDT